MILLGLGAGIAFNPVLLAAMSDVEPSEAGLASGVVNTAFMMGGALGLAVLASLAAARTHGDSLAALTTGYHAAFLAGALFAAAAAVIGGTLLREAAHAPGHEGDSSRPARDCTRLKGNVMFKDSKAFSGFSSNDIPASKSSTARRSGSTSPRRWAGSGCTSPAAARSSSTPRTTTARRPSPSSTSRWRTSTRRSTG